MCDRATVKLVIILGAMTLFGACQSGIERHDRQAQLRERYASYAEEPIDRFTWLGSFYSWESLGQNQLVVYTTPGDAYLLTVTPPCTDLNFAQTIGLTPTAHTVYAPLDSVKVKGWRCPIGRDPQDRLRAHARRGREGPARCLKARQR